MITKVTGEQPFQVLATNFSISPSQQGYTLQISADGVNYSNLFAVSPNVTRMVSGVANGSYYRLSGNTSEVVINWSRQCSTGGGDVDLTNYWTSAQTQDAIDEAVSGITVDLTDYYTSAQTDSHIQSAVTAINERINTKDEVISIALNELHEQLQTAEDELSEAEQVTSTALVDINSRMVSSLDIKTIVKMTQAEYDALATKDNNTLYIIG